MASPLGVVFFAKVQTAQINSELLSKVMFLFTDSVISKFSPFAN